MSFFASRMKIIVEPTGCLGAALAFSNQYALAGKRVGVIVSGGNIDLVQFAKFIHEFA
jgi:threonine dehydratase